ncbi:MAG: oligopeptide/dipeptide ABC transporter ATP-binding protein [Granulosicoccus sp.]|jgi:oligopeptide/dipeptide ABC transporter ATP-binding protein
MPLLEVENLSIAINAKSRLLPVVQNCSFTINENETLGIVGESGCGKSLTALAIMGLLEGSQVRITSGSIYFDGQDLLQVSPSSRRRIMGDQMAMVFQEPMTSLNPVYRIGDQIIEVLKEHRKMSVKEYRNRALRLLKMVKIPDHEQRINSYPHQLSGGQRQRVMIAMALACDPKLIIADEPTTALDVTVQKEVLDLMLDLQRKTGTSIILISHDLGIVSQTCDKVAVMYRGRIVESAETLELFANILHPYTRGLLNSLPSIDSDIEWLDAIPGRVPTLEEQLDGCAFHPRCSFAKAQCSKELPGLVSLKSQHLSRCHFAGELPL